MSLFIFSVLLKSLGETRFLSSKILLNIQYERFHSIKLDSKKSVCLKLEMLYRNKHLLNKNLKQSKKFALKNFSLDKIKKIHTEIYEKI